MTRKFIARHLGYPTQDLVNKTNILRTLKFLKISQYWDNDKIGVYQFSKFKQLIEYAYINVPYYKKLFNSIKLKPSDIRTFTDIEKIPLLTKEIVISENINLLSKNFNMKYVNKGKTGGTTGSPIITYKDITDRSFTWASYYRWYEWMGVELGSRTATLWGARTILSDSLTNKFIDNITNILQNKITIDSFQLNHIKLPLLYKKIKKFKPVLLKGYLSSLLTLAEYIESNLKNEIEPQALSSTSETLLPSTRKYLERIFSAPIYDQYGCGEISAIGYECSNHNGLHINQEHVIVEVLDSNNCNIFEKSGRIIATNLDNYVMPFIRYENGDLATLSNHKCSCGVNQALLSGIDGRTTDTIILKNGTKVHGVFITDILYELEIFAYDIHKFQAIQTIPGQVELLLEKRKSIQKSTVDLLENKLKLFFNDVHVKLVSEITPEINGKYKYIKILR